MRIPLLNLKRQHCRIKSELEAAIAAVFESQRFILGPEVNECENAIAKYAGCLYGVGVSSGTDALLISLMAEGIGVGDEVITTPFTFFSTAGSIARLGANPVFVDIDPVTYNIDATQIESKITRRTRAIIPVHLYGQLADMSRIMAIARKHELVVIEDAAQAIGAEHEGKRAGSWGDYGCFSFFPSKNLGAAGDGGMVVTNDANRAERLQRLRVHGSQPKYYHKFIGGNFRLDTLQAAVLVVKLRYLDAWIDARQSNAALYNRLLSRPDARDSVPVQTPTIVTNRHVFNQYVIRTPGRDALKSFLNDKGVGTEMYYPVPMHLQQCFTYLGYAQGDCPHSERSAKEVLALPIHPDLEQREIEYVVSCIVEYFQHPGE